MKLSIAKYFNCFNHSRKDINLHATDSSLGSPKPEVSLYDDFESSYLTRLDMNNDMPLPSVEYEGGFLTSLSQDLALHSSYLRTSLRMP